MAGNKTNIKATGFNWQCAMMITADDSSPLTDYDATQGCIVKHYQYRRCKNHRMHGSIFCRTHNPSEQTKRKLERDERQKNLGTRWDTRLVSCPSCHILRDQTQKVIGYFNLPKLYCSIWTLECLKCGHKYTIERNGREEAALRKKYHLTRADVTQIKLEFVRYILSGEYNGDDPLSSVFMHKLFHDKAEIISMNRIWGIQNEKGEVNDYR